MLTVAFIMGGTCSGKSTFLSYAKDCGGDAVHLVEVGKMMRAKYPPEHFKGMAAPKHTQDEAWQMFLDGLHDGMRRVSTRLILVDGQPRDVSQALCVVGLRFRSGMHAAATKRYIYLHCPEMTQRDRAVARAETKEDLDLAFKRIKNDRIQLCDVLVALAANGITPEVIETDKNPDEYQPALLDSLMNEQPPTEGIDDDLRRSGPGHESHRRRVG